VGLSYIRRMQITHDSDRVARLIALPVCAYLPAAFAPSQAADHTRDEVHRHAFAIYERLAGFEYVALTRRTVQLTPAPSIGMAIGA
jgi:hypothetical protein